MDSVKTHLSFVLVVPFVAILFWHLTCAGVSCNRICDLEQNRSKLEESVASKSTKAARVAWWWFEAGTEICSTCQQSYAYQTEVYCEDCDSNICPLCVQETETGETQCLGCCSE